MKLFRFWGKMKILKEGNWEHVPFDIQSAGTTVEEAFENYISSLNNYDDFYFVEYQSAMVEESEAK